MDADINQRKRSISQVEGVEEDDATKYSKPRRAQVENQTDLNLELEYPSTSGTRVESSSSPPFQYPFQLVSFSYTPSRKLEFTNSALRYYVEPPRNADLNFHYDTWIKRPEERGRLDGLLEACLHERAVMESKRANIISWRGVMTKILTAPYEERDGWEMNVMDVAGTLYLEEHTTEAKLKEKENMTPRNRLQTYYGYAFESYSTSTTPDPLNDSSRSSNGWGGDINTNEQWCSVVKTKLGSLRLLVGGEVDCVKGRYTGQPNTFVELKTSMSIRNANDEARFEKKLLKFYFQSFLLGVPEIDVGFRTPSGRITETQSFKTMELPRLVRGKPGAWDPNICLTWGQSFFKFLRSSIDALRNDASKESKQERDEAEEKVPVWRVSFIPGKGVSLKLLDTTEIEEVRNAEDRVGFLPKLYYGKATGKDS